MLFKPLPMAFQVLGVLSNGAAWAGFAGKPTVVTVTASIAASKKILNKRFIFLIFLFIDKV
jgi:hypothetical protein